MPLTWLIGLVEPMLGPKLQKFAAPLVYAGLGLLILLALWGAKCAYDHRVVADYQNKVQQRAAPATDKAATERANDTVANARNEEEMHNVIAAQPDQPIAPSTRAQSCERLRRLGRHPPACR